MQTAKRSQVKHSRENIGAGGHICLYIGPMFSGKTTSMAIAVERHARVPGKRCVIVRPKKGERFGTDCATNHRGHDYDMVTQVLAQKLSDVDLSQYDVVGIDEGQFFPDIVDGAVDLANSGKCVVISYIDATFEAEPFGPIGQLVAKAEHVEKLSAVCACGREASFTKRIGESTEEVVVGVDYVAVCRECFNKHANVGSANTDLARD